MVSREADDNMIVVVLRPYDNVIRDDGFHGVSRQTARQATRVSARADRPHVLPDWPVMWAARARIFTKCVYWI